MIQMVLKTCVNSYFKKPQLHSEPKNEPKEVIIKTDLINCSICTHNRTFRLYEETGKKYTNITIDLKDLLNGETSQL